MASDPSEAAMEARTVRFSALKDIQSHHATSSGISADVFKTFAPNRVFPILIPKGYTGRSSAAPLQGEPGLYISVTECPAGTGPALHVHPKNIENFFCLKGQFRIRWGESGDRSLILNEFDLCSVPGGIYRTFENISDEAGLLLVIVQIQSEAQEDDVVLSRTERERLAAEFGSDVVRKLEQIGFRFAESDSAAAR
jgi:uncharacterized RmlC-like cupin family protein